MKFDGKGFAKKIEDQVAAYASTLTVKPKIVSILVGEDPASVLYTGLKQNAAERVGIEFEVVRLGQGSSKETVISQIQKTANDNNVTGIMLQLPVPGLQGVTLKEVISAIPYDKDVDGLRYPESGVVPPVVKAVIEILTAITNLKFPARIASQNDAGGSNSQIKSLGRIVVVGAAGFVGSGVMEQLSQRGVTALGVERGDDMGLIKTGDIVISAVGEEGVIKPEMVKGGAVVIDVGAPKGDMTKEVYQKASVSVEVPGGVGPVTIVCLMENGVKLVL